MEERSADMKKYLSRLWSDDLGQSTTEYILILSVVVMIAMKFKTMFGNKLEGILGKVSDKIGDATDQ
jgi:Flp pilus assembly pilin Flp